MGIREFIDEALEKGEGFKNEVISQLLNSKQVHELLKNETLIHSLSYAFKTKSKLKAQVKKNVESFFKLMDVPTRNEVISLERKLDNIEKTIDRIGKKAITVESLKKIQKRKTTKK